MQWWQIVVTVVCIVLSGTFSGLTLGLMSLDLIDLRVLSQSGTENEKWYALRILPVRRHGNWLLCTLLIGNTAVNAALAIVTADLFGGIAGFLSSTLIILYIGEIIPQAVCHRFGLVIGAYAIPIVRFFMYITAPLSFTTAKLLDFFLGGESATRYNRSQLKSLVSMHGRSRSEQEHPSPPNEDPQSNPSVLVSPVTTQDTRGSTSTPPNGKDTDTVIDMNWISDNQALSNSDSDISPHPEVNVSQLTTVVSPTPAPPCKSSDQNKKNRFNLISKLCCMKNSTNPSNPRHPPTRGKNKDKDSQSSEPPLSKDEMIMLDGAFDFSQKKIGQVMTPLDDVFMLEASLSLNFKILFLIFQSGHSRIPVYAGSRENIIGLVFAKDLILLDPEDAVPLTTVLTFFHRTLLVVKDDTPLNKMLNIFCQGGGHMSLVHKEIPDAADVTIGVVTLEDLIEELIGQDIVDETDVYTDNIHKRRVSRLRSIHPEVLKMFDSKHDEEILSNNEVLAVASYLSNNTLEFSEKFIRVEILREMLAEIPIIECHGGDEQQDKSLMPQSDITPVLSKSIPQGTAGDGNTGENEIADDATIYTKGVPTKNAYLIIHGRLQIIAGIDGFKSEAGPWTLLGLGALTDNLYAPDFTAKVLERPTRLLRISGKHYRLMVHASSKKQRQTEVSSEALRAKGELALAMQSSSNGHRPLDSNYGSASRSCPSLAVAAAAAAVAVGLPNGGESSGGGKPASVDTSVVRKSRSIHNGQSLEWGEIALFGVSQPEPPSVREEVEFEDDDDDDDDEGANDDGGDNNGSRNGCSGKLPPCIVRS